MIVSFVLILAATLTVPRGASAAGKSRYWGWGRAPAGAMVDGRGARIIKGCDA